MARRIRQLVEKGLYETLFKPEVLEPVSLEQMVELVTDTKVGQETDTRPQIQSIFPPSYIGPLSTQEPPQTYSERLLLERLVGVSHYVDGRVTPEQVKNYILGLRGVYLAGMAEQPPINPFLRFRNHVVGIVDNTVYDGLNQAHRIITQNGPEWEARAAKEVDLVDRFYQFFGGDISADLLFYNSLHWVVERYAKNARTQAKVLSDLGHTVAGDHLLQSARSLAQKYDIPVLL